MFLYIAETWQLPRDLEIRHIGHCLRFLRRYRLEGPIAVITEALANRVNASNYHEVFIIAAKLRSRILARDICRRMATFERMRTAKCSVSDLADKLTAREMKELPTHFFYALSKTLIGLSRRRYDDGWGIMSELLDTRPPPVDHRFESSPPPLKKRKVDCSCFDPDYYCH